MGTGPLSCSLTSAQKLLHNCRNCCSKQNGLRGTHFGGLLWPPQSARRNVERAVQAPTGAPASPSTRSGAQPPRPVGIRGAAWRKLVRSHPRRLQLGWKVGSDWATRRIGAGETLREGRCFTGRRGSVGDRYRRRPTNELGEPIAATQNSFTAKHDPSLHAESPLPQKQGPIIQCFAGSDSHSRPVAAARVVVDVALAECGVFQTAANAAASGSPYALLVTVGPGPRSLPPAVRPCCCLPRVKGCYCLELAAGPQRVGHWQRECQLGGCAVAPSPVIGGARGGSLSSHRFRGWAPSLREGRPGPLNLKPETLNPKP